MPPAVAAPALAPRRTRDRLRDYVALTKPRIIELLLVTTVPTMVVAAQGLPPLWLVVATVAGGTLAAGGANAANMYVDRDIDRLMERTRDRPLAAGRIAPRNALAFAVALEVAAFGLLWVAVNPLSAVLAVSACLFYVFVYTIWLKRTSTHNIVIGGAAGAVPVLVGWSAVTGTLAPEALLLFGLIFFWTPPHFWALAIRYRDDYARAEVPMLPAVESVRTTARRILGYTLVVWALSLAFHVVAGMGVVHLAAAVVLGGVFTGYAVALLRGLDTRRAMRLFGWSITYVTLLFAAITVDVLLRWGP